MQAEINNWRAGCNESCTSGSVGGFKKSFSISRVFNIESKEALLNSTQHCESSLDLNEFLIHRPASTLFVIAPDNSMSKYGLFKGDLLIVDRSLKAREGSLILFHYQGEQVIRKVFFKQGKVSINACQKEQLDGFYENAEELEIVGVVKTVIHRFKV